MIKGLSGEIFKDGDCFLEWNYFSSPYYWNKYNLTVLADRYLPDGTRQHLVIEDVPEDCVLDNAQIFTKGAL